MIFNIDDARKTADLFRDVLTGELGRETFENQLAQVSRQLETWHQRLQAADPGASYLHAADVMYTMINMGTEPAEVKDSAKAMVFIALVDKQDWSNLADGVKIEYSLN